MTYRRTMIVVYGPTRAGKDTLISQLTNELRAWVMPSSVNVLVRSSIDPVREFYAQQKRRAGLSENGEWPARERQALADIKAVLDRTINWTVEFGLRELQQSDRCIVMYQVRELDNIAKLRAACKLHAIQFKSVFVHRPGEAAKGATTDVYEDCSLASLDADYVVVNSGSLVNLASHAHLIAESVLGGMDPDFIRTGANLGV